MLVKPYHRMRRCQVNADAQGSSTEEKPILVGTHLVLHYIVD